MYKGVCWGLEHQGALSSTATTALLQTLLVSPYFLSSFLLPTVLHASAPELLHLAQQSLKQKGS